MPHAIKCCQILLDTPRCCQMLLDAAMCYQMLPDAAVCCHLLPCAAASGSMNIIQPTPNVDDILDISLAGSTKLQRDIIREARWRSGAVRSYDKVFLIMCTSCIYFPILTPLGSCWVMCMFYICCPMCDWYRHRG